MSTEIEIVEMPKSHYVSFCDKLREKTGLNAPIKSSELVEKTETVYQTGYEQGKSEGGTSKEEQEKTVDITENGTVEVVPEEGKTLSKVTVNVNVETSSDDGFYNAFWDGYQKMGEQTDYENAFSNGKFTADSLKPKYNIAPIKAQNIFRSFPSICDLRTILDEQKVKLDMLNAGGNYCFAQSKFTALPAIDRSSNYSIYNWFDGCTSLHTIEKLILNRNASAEQLRGFSGCSNLQNISIEGEIGSSIDFGDSPLLSDSSVDSIGNTVVDLTGQNSQTVTFNKAVIEKMSDEQKAVFTNKNWTIVSKG